MSRLRVVFAGTPEFALPALDALADSPHELVLAVTQADKPAGRGRKLTASPVKKRAAARGISVYQPTSLKGSDALQKIETLKPDLMVVVAFGMILPRAALRVPRLGCINIHASLLPRWRGAAPISRAIIAGDRVTGITIMQMDEGLDTGDILLQKKLPIEARETAGALHDRLAALGAEALMQTLPGLAAGTLHPVTQNDKQATYAPKIDKSEALLNWRMPALALERQVRAFNPWPVAETSYEGARLRVWEAEALQHSHTAVPGTVIKSGAVGIDVAAGGGILRLTRVQLPGRKAIEASEFVNAVDLDGTILG